MNGELAIIGMVFKVALDDIVNGVDCACDDIETVYCRACKRKIDPGVADDKECLRRAVNGGWHQITCRHTFRTARAFLFGFIPAWRDYRNELCAVLGRQPGKVEALARERLAHRERRLAGVRVYMKHRRAVRRNVA